MIIPEVRHGAGKHLDQIPPEEFQLGIKLNYITQLLYLFAIVLVKESVGYFLLRIAVIPAYRRTIVSIMGRCIFTQLTTQMLLLIQFGFHGCIRNCLFHGKSISFHTCTYTKKAADTCTSVHKSCCYMGFGRQRHLLGRDHTEGSWLHKHW